MYGSTYHTTPDFRGGWLGARGEEFGPIVVGNADRNSRTGRGGCDPAVSHIVVHPFERGVPGPDLETYGGQFDGLRGGDGRRMAPTVNVVSLAAGEEPVPP